MATMKKRLLIRSCIIAGTLAFLPTARGATILGPERYSKLLENVESDGNEYVDTGLLPTPDMKFTIEFTMPEKATGSTGIFGCRTGGSLNNITLGADKSNIFLDFNSSNYSTYRASSAYEAGVAYRAEISAAERRLVRISDGEVLASNTTTCGDEMDLQRTLWLFCINTGSPWTKRPVACSLLKIEREGKIIRQYVPCELNGQATLFEQVTGTYAAVKGEGMLTGGAPVPDSAPPSVEPLDKSADIGFRLSSIAAGPLDVYVLYGAFDWGLENLQTFIATEMAKPNSDAVKADLGFKLANDMEIDLTFCIDSDDSCKLYNHGIFGARNGASNKNVSVLYCNNTLYIDFNDSAYASYRVSYAGDDTRHTLYNAHLSAKRRALRRVSDGKVLAENTTECPDEFETQTSAALWGVGGTDIKYQAPVSIYGLTIRKGGVILHDYRPVVANGVTNMVDCVTQLPVLSLPLDGFRSGTEIPAMVKASAAISADGSYVAQIKRPRLAPETEYRFGLFAAGGAGKDYAVWGCAHPRTFATGELIARGFVLFLR